MACEIYIPDSKQLFSCLYAKKDEIESEILEHLVWEELPEKKASRIKLISKGNLSNQKDWVQYHSWLLEKVTKFQLVFGEFVKQCAI